MHHKAYYRVVNGKTIYVAEGGEGQGQAADLHERTAIGKHKSGSHYLRASDSEDGKHIEAAAKHLGIEVEKRRAGANHHGRVGAYDHYHAKSLEDAQAIHAHLKKHGAASSGGNPPPAKKGGDDELVTIKEATPNKGYKIPPPPKEGKGVRDRAWDASKKAFMADKGKAGNLHAKAENLHWGAGNDALIAHAKKHAAKDDSARDEYHAASKHFQKASEHSSQSKGLAEHAEYQSKQAEHLGKIADSHKGMEDYHDHDAHSAKRLMAIESHGRARDAHRAAQYGAIAKGDAEEAQKHQKIADKHHAEVERHYAEMKKGHDEIEARRDAAYKASGEAKDAAGHKAAAEAHRHAAKINYDSDIRAMHAQNAEMHDKMASDAEEKAKAEDSQALKEAKGKTWGGSFPHGDMRGILHKDSARKPASWKEVHSEASPVGGSDDEVGALKHLHDLHGVHEMSGSPMDKHKPHTGTKADDPKPVEFIGHHGGQHYYVNTEGYDYARYARHIPPGVAEKAGIGKKPAASNGNDTKKG